ncbi:MAG: hypothetical protein Q4E21_08960 [Clostridia bacterium]|nr:hypothetical protein [Clostridia bacterium]
MVRNPVSVREAVISDCEAITALCREDLGYACTPELLQTRIAAVDKSRERVFVAIQGGNCYWLCARGVLRNTVF